MKVAITQPNFLPWIGYFDLLDTVDLWVCLDDVQLTKRSFVVRNRVVDKTGKPSWLSLNVAKQYHRKNINETFIHVDSKWKNSIVNKLCAYYRKARYFSQYSDGLFNLLPEGEFLLSKYNTQIIKSICQILGIKIEVIYSSELNLPPHHSPQDKILSTAKLVGAKSYYNFRNGVLSGLYAPYQFKEQEIKFYMQDYQHPKYTQFKDSANFHSFASIIDLLFHEGPSSLAFLKQGRKWLDISDCTSIESLPSYI
ncbi:WbqC family protein [Aliikangiella sp. G2MR2-5]|uniref:WbqC family protein n=1 Tax=Aliikangiella sp. G2MR2-5 TaxID=2788943 RepID=UPI0018AA834A|nr:WbqC family protein [Aliikangiella sp. G2MR2-5]